MQPELTTSVIIGSQDPTAKFVPKLRLDKRLSTQLQPIIEEELHARVRMRSAGIDGEMMMSEIGIVGELVL